MFVMLPFFFPAKEVTITLHLWIQKQQNSMFSNCIRFTCRFYFLSSKKNFFFHDKETKMVHWIFHFLSLDNGFSWLHLKTLLHWSTYFTTHCSSDVVVNQIHYKSNEILWKVDKFNSFEWNFIGHKNIKRIWV